MDDINKDNLDINKSKSKEESRQFFLFKKITLNDRFNFYEYLSIMLDGGVGLTESLESVQSKMKNIYFKNQVKDLLEFVKSGDSLSKSMKKMPHIFPPSEYSIIEAGEKSGTLHLSLNTLANESKRVHELTQSVKSALSYPIIIILFLVLAIVVVMTYVIPGFMPLIEETGAKQGFATTSLIAVSDFVSGRIVLLILLTLLVSLLFYGYKSVHSGKRNLQSIYLSLPLIGSVYKNYILSSSAALLGVLMNSGIPVVKTITLVGRSTNNIIYNELYDDVASGVRSGKKIVQSIVDADPEHIYFPQDFIQLLSVGEKTATVDKVCKKLSEQYSREMNYSLNMLTKWIEPLAILIAGIFVLWFAFAIFGAILGITGSIA